MSPARAHPSQNYNYQDAIDKEGFYEWPTSDEANCIFSRVDHVGSTYYDKSHKSYATTYFYPAGKGHNITLNQQASCAGRLLS